MKLIHDLRNTSSRIAKENILKLATKLEKQVLHYTYNPHIRFNIANGVVTSELGEPNEQLLNLLKKLAAGELRGNAAREAVNNFAKANGSLIHLICKKDLDCGISVKTINKVFPLLVPEFKVQLAKEVPLNKIAYPKIAQIKYDGVRVIARVTKAKVELLTRNGKVINCPELSNIIKAKISDEIILDGELTNAIGKTDGRTTISGRVNSAIHGGILSTSNLAFNVFDCMSLKDFDRSICTLTYNSRFKLLNNYIELINNNIVKAAKQYEVNSAEQANSMYNKLVKQNYEGIILKDKNHLYSFKRSKDWVKVKAIKTADLKCIAIVQGGCDTKYANQIGALTCVGIIDNKPITVNVGSGLSDLQRSYDSTKFIGKTIEIKYNEVLRNHEDNGWTLFLPRFNAVRFDK